MSLIALLWIALAQSFVSTGTDSRAHHAAAIDWRQWAAGCACAPAARPTPAERPLRTSSTRLGDRIHADRLLAPATLATPRGGPSAADVPTLRSGSRTGWVLPSLAHRRGNRTIARVEAAMADHTSRVVAARGGLVPYFLIPPPVG